jgi:hypothetical protein
MKKFLLTILLFVTGIVAAQNLPPNPVGTVNQTATYQYQNFTYSFTAPTTGIDYFGLAFRQDPGYWSVGNFSLTASGSSINLLSNPNLAYGGTVNGYGIQAPANWGIWYQTSAGAPPAAGFWSAPGQGWYGSYTGGLGVNTSTAGSWIDGAVGTYDGIYQGFSARAGTTYTFSFTSLGTDPYSNPSIMIGVYAGACAAGGTVFSCTPNSASGFTAAATPQQTQGTGGAPPPSSPTVVSTTTTNQTVNTIVGSQVVVTTTPVTTTTYSDGSTTTTQGTSTNSVASNTAFTGVHFGRAQVADTQWNVHACTQTATCQIYSTNPGVTYNTGSPTSIGATQYVTFIPNTGSDRATNPWNMILVNSDGTYSSLGTGHILVQGTDSSGNIFLFFSNSQLNGTVLSGNLGLSGQGMTFSGTQNPTADSTNTLAANMSSTPLAAGQTGGTPVSTLCCGGSSAPFNANSTYVALTNLFANRTTRDSQVYIQQVGDNNTITVNQEGTRNNYAYVSNSGSGSNIAVTQSGNSSTQVNYSYNNISGNYNSVNITQTSTGGGKGSFVTVANSNNTVSVTQTDSGSHYAEIGLTGGNKSVSVTQSGSASHMASIQLSGNPASLTLSQTGATQNFYGIQFNCASAGGCAAIQVRQGN